MICARRHCPYSIPPWLRGQVAIGSFIYSFYRVVLLVSLRPASSGCAVAGKGLHSAAWCAPGAEPGYGSARSAFRCSPICLPWRALGIGLAGLAGVLLAPIYSIHPAMGRRSSRPPSWSW